MDPHSRAPKKNTSQRNEILPQDTTHLIQRPCYQRGSPYQGPAGNRTTRRPDQGNETQTKVAWTCLLFVRSGKNHLARHSERGDRPGVGQVLEYSGQQRKMEETDREVICGAAATLAVKG